MFQGQNILFVILGMSPENFKLKKNQIMVPSNVREKSGNFSHAFWSEACLLTVIKTEFGRTPNSLSDDVDKIYNYYICFTCNAQKNQLAIVTKRLTKTFLEFLMNSNKEYLAINVIIPII